MFSCFMFCPYVECLAVCSKLGLCLYIYVWCLLEDFHVAVSKKTSECLPAFEDCVAAGQLPWCDCCPVCKGEARVPHCCECLLEALMLRWMWRQSQAHCCFSFGKSLLCWKFYWDWAHSAPDSFCIEKEMKFWLVVQWSSNLAKRAVMPGKGQIADVLSVEHSSGSADS